MKQDGTLSEEESAQTSFIADSLLRTRKDCDILYDVQHIEFILLLGPVLKLLAARERRRLLRLFFSRLLESRHAEASFIAYLVCYDWLQAENTSFAVMRKRMRSFVRILIRSIPPTRRPFSRRGLYCYGRSRRERMLNKTTSRKFLSGLWLFRLPRDKPVRDRFFMTGF